MIAVGDGVPVGGGPRTVAMTDRFITVRSGGWPLPLTGRSRAASPCSAPVRLRMQVVNVVRVLLQLYLVLFTNRQVTYNLVLERAVQRLAELGGQL